MFDLFRKPENTRPYKDGRFDALAGYSSLHNPYRHSLLDRFWGRDALWLMGFWAGQDFAKRQAIETTQYNALMDDVSEEYNDAIRAAEAYDAVQAKVRA